jgi:hypothetical protein
MILGVGDDMSVVAPALLASADPGPLYWTTECTR